MAAPVVALAVDIAVEPVVVFSEVDTVVVPVVEYSPNFSV